MSDFNHKEILKAAVEALGKYTGEESSSDIAKVVFKALCKSNKLCKEEDFDASDVVATAFFVWSNEINIDEHEFHPKSVAGDRILGFAQGMAAASAVGEAFYFLGEDDAFFTAGTNAEQFYKK